MHSYRSEFPSLPRMDIKHEAGIGGCGCGGDVCSARALSLPNILLRERDNCEARDVTIRNLVRYVFAVASGGTN